MKKIITLAIFFSFVFAGSAMSATLLATSAQDGMELWSNASVDALIGKCSKGVRVGVEYDAVNGGAFALTTVHKKGSKYYGTAYDGTSLFVMSPPGDINDSFSAPTTSVSDTAFAGDWKAL